jgi:Flavin containing amine oxidoreductase
MPVTMTGNKTVGLVLSFLRDWWRILFAGEHTARWNGWIEGAFEPAQRVAREINETTPGGIRLKASLAQA